MRSTAPRPLVRAAAALTLAVSCAASVIMSTQAPVAAVDADAAAAALPAPATAAAASPSSPATVTATVAATLADPADLERRAREIAEAASRSERASVAQAPGISRINVRVAGKTARTWTHAATVAEVLAQLHIRLDYNDTVKPALSTRLSDGQTVTVTRVQVKRRTTKVRISFDVTRIADSTLLRGHDREVRAGRAGTRTRVWKLTYRDGSLVHRELVDSTVTKKPVDGVLAYGTKAPPVTTSSNGYPTYGGLNWRALARCESGNDPHSRDVPYYGLYQFLISTWQSVGGSGNPADASMEEQTRRAWILYQREGRHPWPVCGKYL